MIQIFKGGTASCSNIGGQITFTCRLGCLSRQGILKLNFGEFLGFSRKNSLRGRRNKIIADKTFYWSKSFLFKHEGCVCQGGSVPEFMAARGGRWSLDEKADQSLDRAMSRKVLFVMLRNLDFILEAVGNKGRCLYWRVNLEHSWVYERCFGRM